MKRIALAASVLVALTGAALADGCPGCPPAGVVPPPPPPAYYPGQRGVVMTNRGLTAAPYIYSPGGLPPVVRGPGGSVQYVPPPPPQPAPYIGGPMPAPRIVPNIWVSPFPVPWWLW